ncbi:MAG TPA: PPOX class F420-dependent oxidoreductase [Actinocatenispora sp.]
MTTPDVEALLARPLHAVVGLNRPDRPPQLTVVWFDWDGSTFRFSTTRSRAKYANLRRDPRLSLLVDDPVGNTYVVAYGRARVEPDGHAELSRRLFARYLPGQDLGGRPEDPDRVVVALTPDRILTGS